MTKTMTAGLFAAALAAGTAAYAGTEGAKAAAPETTLKGEVLDLACYMSHEGKGEKHASCGKACLMGGGQAGLLGADGNIILLVQDHDKKKPYKSACELAGHQAEVTGQKVTKGGLTAILVTAVKKG